MCKLDTYADVHLSKSTGEKNYKKEDSGIVKCYNSIGCINGFLAAVQ